MAWEDELDDFFDDLEQNVTNITNLKDMLNFEHSNFLYNGKEIDIKITPKKKLNVSVYIKPNNNTNKLF